MRELAAVQGPPEVLCVSPLPYVGLIKPVLDTTPQDLLSFLQLGVVSIAAATRAVLPAMREQGHGTVLVTTGSGALSPSPDRAASGVTTTAVTIYVQMLHEALAPHGVHVAHVAILGPIGPRLQHDPADVADQLWTCHVHRDQASVVLR